MYRDRKWINVFPRQGAENAMIRREVLYKVMRKP